MKQKTLKLEFTYAAQSYKNGHADCIQFEVTPKGDLKDMFTDDFKIEVKSVASVPLDVTLGNVAAGIKEAVRAHIEPGTQIAEKASFENAYDGEVIEVAPAKIKFH